jgi:Tfp pilus assembly protein PilF
MNRSHRILSAVTLLALVGLGCAVYFIWFRRAPLPGPGSPEYLEYLRAFQVGVAALDSGRDDLAKEKLAHAVELIPEEPAGWANLGLLSLRKNKPNQAAEDLRRAHDLAPASAEIEALLGALAEQQGRQSDAVRHYRKTVEKRPHDVALLYTLAQAVSKEGGDSDAEYQQLMERILKLQPNNLRVLGQRASAAVRRKDEAAYADSLKRFIQLASGWTTESRDVLDELRKAPPPEVMPLLQDLDRVLQAERSYKRDSRAVVPQPNVLGSPIYTFLKLQSPRATPAPPDSKLDFEARILPGEEKTRAEVVRPVWLMNEQQRAELVQDATDGGMAPRPAATLTPALFIAAANQVRRSGAEAPKIAFPGGPRKVAPTAAGVLAFDGDNDFRMDLLLVGAGGLRFWQQKSDGSFVDVTAKTGLPQEILDGDYVGAWAADIEMDGDLDVIVARRSGAPLVLRNNRDATFKAIEPFAGVRDVRAFVWADFDNDGAPDAAFLDAKGKLHVFANERAGQFAAWPLPDTLGAFVALAAADVNFDGTLDLVALRSDGGLVRISDEDQRRSWQVAELARSTIQADAALFIEDLDNNGALDIVVAGPKSAEIFLADEEGKFAKIPRDVAMHVTAVLDLDHDGRLDLVGRSLLGEPMVSRNLSEKYRWQTVWPLANPKLGDDRINSFALGGEIELRAGLLVQKHAINGPVVHFGLGEQSAADVVRIVWPNGVPQWEFDVPGDRFLAAGQRLSGSCPFLFTYDGQGMRFAGDFMWGTPLGMYVNGQNIGDFPQTTEWLKIRGEHLVPRDGYYDIRVHANLWETDYFDQLALIVVDHPADTEIHVDERFFLTPTKPKLHVTTPARPVAKAWDHHGKEVTELVRAVDGRYVDRAGRGRFQGLTHDHWIEVDLGDEAPRAGPVLLVARGWLHPTNSSINVALAQGKHDGPRPLSLEIPDGKGGWKSALPALGFPAGKDKTMLIRLDGIDGIDGKGVSRRFRLRTNMEIFWDYLGYATELDPKIARLQRPAPTSAELRYHGITAMTQKDRSSPEVPVYDKVNRVGQPWRDLAGYYTRFGDVRELLAKVDDRYVIANAGDEIAFRFPVPAFPPSPSGTWKRDFIWECDGWTRDGDLNTRFGHSVLPLPAHGKNQERPPGRLMDDPVFRRFPHDWRTFHTRYVTGEEFSRGLRR